MTTRAATTSRCPSCGECPFEKGVCERLANRGRRFFLMGALALPVARKIEALVPIVKPPALEARLLINGHQWTWQGEPIVWRRDGQHPHLVEAHFALAL